MDALFVSSSALEAGSRFFRVAASDYLPLLMPASVLADCENFTEHSWIFDYESPGCDEQRRRTSTIAISRSFSYIAHIRVLTLFTIHW